MTKQPPLEAYDHKKFGPILGVSDEGSAAKTIADAAYAAAKAQACENADDSIVGVIIDGERMGSAGEVPVGPDEYAVFFAEARGRTFSTTNVGVRVNARWDQPLPEFRVADATGNEQVWLDRVFKEFFPFIHTPDGKPRPLTVRLRVDSQVDLETLRELVPKIEAQRTGGDNTRLGTSELHRLSFLMAFCRKIEEKESADIRRLLKLARELKVPEVAIDGIQTEAARRRVTIQGLLNVLDAKTAQALLTEANELGVSLVHVYEVDQDTAARTIWTGLNSARSVGLSGAKYGLVPLTFEQQAYVVNKIQAWLAPEWTPIPAFYVDTPLVTKASIYDSDKVVDAAKLWMKMIAGAGVKVALIDAPDRIEKHRLMKSGDTNDIGVLTLGQVKVLSAYADELGLKVLWSGGIEANEAFELGRLGVGGIFTTGSTAELVAVHGPMTSDARLAQMAEPTSVGVRRIHALLQAGFLTGVLKTQDTISEITAGASRLVQCKKLDTECLGAVEKLNQTLVTAWKAFWK